MLENYRNKKIIFFDGVCNLCNGFVDFIIQNDRHKIFYFASLQSHVGARAQQKLENTLSSNDRQVELSTVLFFDGQKILQKSTAILYIAKELGWPYRILFYFRFVPTVLRDKIYDIVAQNRYRIWGKKDTCRIPTPQEKERFL